MFYQTKKHIMLCIIQYNYDIFFNHIKSI
ncbi:hypothetical protein [Plasmodium yoelii yoelii]|uniref:Uncharacterized protein n=1 Tax=Plasmodium yoelii yoelii TaxID=73239 RepID=Q7R8Z6_PLAYO|nr:hypothetical protein [Plasmodium yoelii yoelii]